MSALRELGTIIASGDAMLFTGAGFSADACDLDGKQLPDSEAMRRELWPLIFDDDPEPDDSSLQDLYDVGLVHATERLHAYVGRRLRIGETALPAHFAAWFSAPWKRIYTLNVDDLEVAVARQFPLPRLLRSISAIARARLADEPDTVDVVHLNGFAGSDAAELTFSTLQYAARLCGRDREYERLLLDLDRAPFVFAGTTLDEVILWQHLELHRQANGAARGTRPPAFLISSSLSRARRVLLESLGIRWVQATIAEVADAVLR